MEFRNYSSRRIEFKLNVQNLLGSLGFLGDSIPWRSWRFNCASSMTNGKWKIARRILDSVVTVLYPESCRVCGSIIDSMSTGVACSACWQQFDEMIAGRDNCIKCGVVLREIPTKINRPDRRCGLCDDLAFDIARSCGPYEGALRESVIRLKTVPQIPNHLRGMIFETFAQLNAINRIDSIVPVPLHSSRYRERSFNQADVIAEILSKQSGLRIDRSSLVRVRATSKHRAGMSGTERRRSLDSAFVVRAKRLVTDQSILLVDDVMTTGSTASEIAGTLLKYGAARVSVLVLARASEYGFPTGSRRSK